MQILLASAKMMDSSCPQTYQGMTSPLFMTEARALAQDLSNFTADELSSMLSCSRELALQNIIRYGEFEDSRTVPAIMAYTGQAYRHLKAATFSPEDLDYAQGHLWISSFLYGLLRPLDGIHTYRLEGKVRLPSTGGRTVFDFWKDRLTEIFIDSIKADDGILVHLATEEFQRLFDWKRVCSEVTVIQPMFFVESKDGSRKIQAVWAKTCRGAMARYLIDSRTASPESIMDFSYEGFRHDALSGDELHPHFIR
ncbi:MAG: YaaA family protein [Paraprevotella sp.]|nr:YaaA family protein [Paraprevotella sp.]